MTIWVGPREETKALLHHGPPPGHVYRMATDTPHQRGLLELHEVAAVLQVGHQGFRMEALNGWWVLAYYVLFPSKAYLALHDADVMRLVEVKETSLEDLISRCRVRWSDYSY